MSDYHTELNLWASLQPERCYAYPNSSGWFRFEGIGCIQPDDVRAFNNNVAGLTPTSREKGIIMFAVCQAIAAQGFSWLMDSDGNALIYKGEISLAASEKVMGCSKNDPTLALLMAWNNCLLKPKLSMSNHANRLCPISVPTDVRFD